MKKTLIIPIVAVIAIAAILTVPGIFAKISGQHAFIEGELVECETCHNGIADQLAASSAHAGAGWVLPCEACHDVGPAEGDKAHAATTVSCSECHEKRTVSFWHDLRDDYDIPGFNPPENCGVECHYRAHHGGHSTASSTPEGELAFDSHVEFYEGAKASDVLLHADEACIMCHTEAEKDITMLEHTLTYNADTNEFGMAP